MGIDFARRLDPRRGAPARDPEPAARLTIQRRLEVGSANDPLEREADEVAAQVLRRLQEPVADADGPVGAHDCPTPAVGSVRRTAAGGDGFTAAPEVESAIESARGGGRPLEPRVRRRFEGAMGADLGAVRVHTGTEADQLNRAVAAKAFTTGNDVFFSRGTYDPNGSAGQELLAHELTHTVQQGVSTGRARRRTVQRLALQGTDFSQVNDVKVFSGGGSGKVAKFSDGGTPLIVKVDQLIGNEVVVAGNLLAANDAQGGASGGYRVQAPASRIASPQEVQEIKAATLRCLQPGDDPRNFVTGLDGANPVVVAEMSSGQSFLDVIREEQHGVTDKKGRVKADPDSILFKMVKSSGPFTALARASVPDLVMGMKDRLHGLWNPENFLYDDTSKTFNFVDNTQNSNSGFITTVDLGQWGIYTSKESFDSWAGLGEIRRLTSDIPDLANKMLETVTGLDANGNVMGGILDDFPRRAQPEVYQLLLTAMRKNRKKMLGYVANGLKAGLRTVRAQLKNPLPLVAGIQPDKKLEAVQSLLAKGYVLDGMAPDAAWTKAGVEAARLVPQAPARPTTAPPPLPTNAPPPSTGTGWTNGVVPGRGRVAIGSHRG